MMALVLLASTAFITPAVGQSSSIYGDDEQSEGVESSNTFLRGTTSNGTGRNDDADSNGYVAYPGNRPQSASADGSPDPLVPSYADTVSQAANPDGPEANALLAQDGSSDNAGGARSIDASQAEDNQFGRVNTATGTIDGVQTGSTDDDNELSGIRIGTMTLRPTLTQKIVHESNNYGATSENRTYSETTLEGALESDWSRHKLTIDGKTAFQKNFSGTSQEEPEAEINTTFDLDISEEISAQLRAGYNYSLEDRTDPNAVANATAQAGVHRFATAASLTRNLGQLRGTATAEFGRTIYGDATLADTSVISGRDRANTDYGLRARVGYEVSPSLIPFVEASVNKLKYDIKSDAGGYQRSATTYGLKLGSEFPMGEKVSGELAVGYLNRKIEDSRLTDIGSFSVDGMLNWSPMRGTTVNAALSTALESSTTADQSGSVVHQLSLGLEHELRAAVVAKLTGTALRRNFQGTAAPTDQTTLGLTGELDWSVNRYLSVVTEAGYERTTQSGTQASSTARIGVGLRLRR